MRAKTAVVLGAQWGDEGKGKIVDVLSERFSAVARYAGGHNAGHTVIIGGQKFVLQLIPAAYCVPVAKASSATAWSLIRWPSCLKSIGFASLALVWISSSLCRTAPR